VNHIRLIHWNADEALNRAQQLAALGHQVVTDPFDRNALRAMREDPPQAVVIDLSRLPSQGRDAAVAIRSYKATRHVPLVFVGGQREKLEKTRALLPDAVYTTWEDIDTALQEAIAHPPSKPVVPRSVMEAYSGAPLPKKLGIRPNSIVSLVGAPDGFQATLGELPEGVELRTQVHTGSSLTLWFARSRDELESGIERMSSLGDSGGLWILWPKKSSHVESDLSEGVVRQVALASGLVDFKVCSVDETWSALRFARRDNGRARP
jgi:CheY-like chemotaxis protein